MHNELNDFL